MRALSFTQPWLWAILHGGKRIENRVAWKGCGYRGPILLHAAKSVGTRAEFSHTAESILSILAGTGTTRPANLERFRFDCLDFDRLRPGVPGAPEPRWLPRSSLHRGGIVGRARIVGVVRDEESFGLYASRVPTSEARAQRAWWFGSFALVLADVEPLPFTPWKGALGLFEVPDDYTSIAAAAGAP